MRRPMRDDVRSSREAESMVSIHSLMARTDAVKPCLNSSARSLLSNQGLIQANHSRVS
jgi:hypothetical protein